MWSKTQAFVTGMKDTCTSTTPQTSLYQDKVRQRLKYICYNLDVNVIGIIIVGFGHFNLYNFWKTVQHKANEEFFYIAPHQQL